jgi:hypothetical protein
MDTYIRTNSGAPLITPRSARGMSDGKYARLTAANAKKTEVQTDAFKAFEAPQMKSAETSKSNVRQKLQAIAKRLQILKKLFAGNPKETAKALAQVFKELKAALKEYKAATDKELGGSDAAVSATPPAGTTTADTADTTTDERPPKPPAIRKQIPKRRTQQHRISRKPHQRQYQTRRRPPSRTRQLFTVQSKARAARWSAMTASTSSANSRAW